MRRERAIAAIWQSAGAMGRPVERRLAAMSAYARAAPLSNGSTRFSKASPSILSMSETSVSRRWPGGKMAGPRSAVLLRRPRMKNRFSRRWARLRYTATVGSGALLHQFGHDVGVQYHSHGRGVSRRTAARGRARCGGISRSTPLAGPKCERMMVVRFRGTRLAPDDIAQDQARFLFHGAAIVRRPHTRPGLDGVVEVAKS